MTSANTGVGSQEARPDDPQESLGAWLAYVAAGAALVAVAQLLPAGPIRAVVVAPVLLVLPGWLLLRLLMRDRVQADATSQLLYSIGLSIAVILAGALIVNAIGAPLGRLTLALASLGLSALTVAAAVLLDVPLVTPAHALHRVLAHRRSLRWAVGLAGIVLVASLATWIAAIAAPVPEAPTTVSMSLGSSYARLSEALTTSPGEVIRIPVVASQTNGTEATALDVTTDVDGRRVGRTHLSVPPRGSLTITVSVTAPPGPFLHRVVVHGSGAGVTDSLIVYLQNGRSLP